MMDQINEKDLEIVVDLSDVYSHNLRTMDNISPRFPLLRLAGLLHDIGKPPTKEFNTDKQDWSFHNHETIGARLTEQIAKKFKFSTKDTKYLTTVVQNHMYFVEFKTKSKTLKRWMAENPYYKDNLRLRFADRRGNLTKLNKSKTTYHLWLLIRRLRKLANEQPALTLKTLQINGTDIMNRYNLLPSPKVGEVLNFLFQAFLDDKVQNTKETLLQLADEYMKG